MTGSGAFDPDLFEWDAWRPEEVVRILAGVEAPWYVAAGWAIDLFLGGERREREDLEIAVPRARLDEVLEALAGFEFFAAGVPGPGLVTPLTHAGDALETYHQTPFGVRSCTANAPQTLARRSRLVALRPVARRAVAARSSAG